MNTNLLRLLCVVSLAASAVRGADITLIENGQSLGSGDRVAPGSLRHHTTIRSIGIEWDVAGDTDRDAACGVRFRRKGATGWREALPLMRIHYAWYYGKKQAEEPANMLAGSILFLAPDTEYELRLDLTDPDGGAAMRELTVRTRPVPRLPAGGRTFHVVPGTGGGEGTREAPFEGIDEAQKTARPGDIFLLHAGNYGQAVFERAGAAKGRYLVWKAAGDGEARFQQVRIKASHVWLDGLTVRRDPELRGAGIYAPAAVTNAVLTRNTVTGFNYCIALTKPCRDWTISDNTIVGDKAFDPEHPDPNHIEGEGIELNQSGGHVVCHNRISRVADGVSYPSGNTDIYNNDIFDVSDDALEPDRGGANIRIWGNRLTGFGENGISFQPMVCGPCYIVRNQFVGTWRPETTRIPKAFKFRVLDRFVCVNNTFVVGRYLSDYCDCLFLSLCRNNLFVSATGKGPIWVGMRYPESVERRVVLPLQHPGPVTDVDYNGYDWGAEVVNGFRYQGVTPPQKEFLPDLQTFAAITGTEQHSRRVRKEEVFEHWNIPAGPGRVDPHNLVLKPDGAAIDAGVPLPNLCEEFKGSAPDLGAFEAGTAAPHVGPRDVELDRGKELAVQQGAPK